MSFFRSGPSVKELKQQNYALEAHEKRLNSEIKQQEKLYRNRESEIQECEQREAAAELQAQRADAARQEARSTLAEAEHVLAVRKGEEEAQSAEGQWTPHLLVASARAVHIEEENAFLEQELQESKQHTEECQERLKERGAELEEGTLRARSIHGALSAEISRARTQLAALQLEGSHLEARHAEEVQQRDKLIRKTEEGAEMLEMERHEGERLTAELLRLREDLQSMWADYWESVPYIDVGTDLAELQKLQELEQKSSEQAALVEKQLRAERGRRQAVITQGRSKCEELRKRIARLQQTNSSLTPEPGGVGGYPTVQSAMAGGGAARRDCFSTIGEDSARQLNLASPLKTPLQNINLDFSEDISPVDGYCWEGSSNGKEVGHSRFQFHTPLQEAGNTQSYSSWGLFPVFSVEVP
eukprot:gnl/MRDRNA2_/MRDRNA2_127685_c0_seq1.p1 gnl/MRDRNA2_/MRDRNA2_127685_c0~~gnl/MRDRNA2_/MRDRNA2_127685_c0_seq1.p1  ORF type:complete len:414 (-),score=110.03 gnl/MRDRNA2_/MRDRNA2_127685_c0_seq1:191-1432(-)